MDAGSQHPAYAAHRGPALDCAAAVIAVRPRSAREIESFFICGVLEPDGGSNRQRQPRKADAAKLTVILIEFGIRQRVPSLGRERDVRREVALETGEGLAET